MLVVLIVLPALVVAVAVVVVLDRLGVLPHLDTGPTTSSGSGFLERVPPAALYAAGALMAAWIVAWLVFLVIGMKVLAS